MMHLRIKKHFDRDENLGSEALIRNFALFGNERITEKEKAKKSYNFKDLLYGYTFDKALKQQDELFWSLMQDIGTLFPLEGKMAPKIIETYLQSYMDVEKTLYRTVE